MVDDSDFDSLNQWKWLNNGHGYAIRIPYIKGKKKVIVWMHREIMRPEKSRLVDHKNGDRLDNRRENLRICSRAENAMNSRKKMVGAASKFKGVHFDASRKSFSARITKDNKPINLGYFIKEEDAARAYNKAAVKHFGDFASLNVITSSV